MYLDSFIDKIQELCENYNVRNLCAFGSVLTENFNNDSDIDFLVDIKSDNPMDYAENYFDLKFKLEELLQRPIDLLEEKALKNPFLIQSINKSKKHLYEA